MIKAKFNIEDVFYFEDNKILQQNIVDWFDENFIYLPILPKIGYQVSLEDFMLDSEMKEFLDDYCSFPIISSIVIKNDHILIFFKSNSAE